MAVMVTHGLLREIHIAVEVAEGEPHLGIQPVVPAVPAGPEVELPVGPARVLVHSLYRLHLRPPTDLLTAVEVVVDRAIHGAVPLDFLASAATEEMVVLAWP
jgi:hypothetical protein